MTAMLTHPPDRDTAAPATPWLRFPAWLPRVAPYAGVALVTVVLGLPSLILPLHPDHALFVLIARAVARGDVLYLDVWDVKPPLIYLLYLLPTRLPFDGAVNVRVFDIGWTALTTALVYELGRRYWSWRAGLIAALLFALLWSTNDPWSQSAQPDSLVVLPLALGLLLYEAGRGRRWWLVAAGVLFGCAFQLRFTTVFYLPLLPLVELTATRHQPRQAMALWLRRMVWIGVGFGAVQLALLLYLALGGALGEFVATLRYASGYTRTGGPWNTAEGPELSDYLKALRTAFWIWAGPRLLLTLPALAAGAYGWLVVRERRVQQLVLFSALTYAGIAMQAKFFWYHFGYMPLFLALISGWGWDRLLSLLRRTHSFPVALSITGALAGLLLVASTEVWDSGIRHWSGFYESRTHAGSEAYRASFAYHLAEEEVAAYVRERTRPDDTIFVWGFDPLIYLRAERASASRFLLVFPLMSDWAPARWQQEYIAELERARPVYIVVLRGTPGSWIVGHNISLADYVERFPAFQDLLFRHYEYETDVAGAALYRRIG